MPRPGDAIELNADQLRALGGQLWDILTDLEREHAEEIADHAIHWDWYYCIPEERIKSVPWPGASNLQVPVIRNQVDAQSARFVLQVFSGNQLWALSSQHEFWRELTPSMSEYQNHSARVRNGGYTLDHIEPWIVECQALGRSVLEQGWGKITRTIVSPNPNAKKPLLVTLSQGPVFRHRPVDRVLYNRSGAIYESDVLVTQDYMTWGQLSRQFAQDDRFIKSQFDGLHEQSGITGPNLRVENDRREREGLAPYGQSAIFDPHDIRTFWIDMPLLRVLDRSLGSVPGVNQVGRYSIDEVNLPAVITYHPRSRRVLRPLYCPYLLDHTPHYEIIRRRSGRMDGGARGLCKDLEHVQRGTSTVVNQWIDGTTFRDSLKIATSDKRLESRRWVPNTILYLSDPQKQLKEIRMDGGSVQDLSLLNFLMAMAERGNTADPGFGRESRMGGHPSPATNFLGMLQQSQMNSAPALLSIRQALSKAGEHRLVMSQQFEKNPNGWIGQVFGEKDAANIMRFLSAHAPLIGQVECDVRSLSATHNPDAERQKAVVIDQMVTNHYIIVAKYVEALSNPQAPPALKTVLAKAIEAKTTSLVNFLNASEIDDVEEYVLELNRNKSNGVALLNDLARLIRQGNPNAPQLPGGEAVQNGQLPGGVDGLTGVAPAGAGGGGAPGLSGPGMAPVS